MTNSSSSHPLQSEFRQQFSHYLLAGFGLVAGLAWNDAIKALIDYIFPQGGETVVAKLIYAGVMTVVVVLVSRSVTTIFRVPSS
jgi:hypothetical protein